MEEINLKNIFIACLHYYSFPIFPRDCKFNFNSEFFLRDMLACSSNDENNHYEYPKFQDFSYDMGCNIKNIPRIKNEFLDGKDVYVLFRTTLKNIDKSISYISGYYRISQVYKINTWVLGTFDHFGFKSDEVIFVKKEDAKPWTSKQKRGAVYSTNSKYKAYLFSLLKHYKSLLNTKKNQSENYKNLTLKLLKNLKDQKFRSLIYNSCTDCIKNECFLKKRMIYFQKKTNDKDYFYLDYLYNQNVFLTDILDKLINERKVEILQVK